MKRMHNSTGSSVKPSRTPRGTPVATKMVEFYTTSHGRVLEWYMKIVEWRANNAPPMTLQEVNKLFLYEFHLFKYKQ